MTMKLIGYFGCLAVLLGVLGCAESNEKDFTAKSGPGWAPPGAPVDGEKVTSRKVRGRTVEGGE